MINTVFVRSFLYANYRYILDDLFFYVKTLKKYNHPQKLLLYKIVKMDTLFSNCPA